MGRLQTFLTNALSRPSKIDGVSIAEIDSAKPKDNIRSSSRNDRIKQFFVKFAGKIKSYVDAREMIVAPDYDFDDIFNASETDSYVKMALSKYKSLIFKAGYQLKSENDNAISYLKKRFKVFSITCGKPIDILFQEISDDIVTYSNAFIIKARSEDEIYPGTKAGNIFGDAPVSGYFRLDPRCVYIKTNKRGTIEYYLYRSYGQEEQKIKPYDMIHFYIDRAPDKKYGTPRIVAALEDVKLLRRIEGNVMALIYRFSMPIYHWSVGLEKEGMGATEKEITELTNSITGMEMDGCIVTNERTKVNAIGADKTALDASGYLNYFEKRVFSALGVSESQMGRGGSKQDADSMEAQIHDSIKHYQRTIAIFIENYMLTELLLEGGFDPISNEDDYVHYEFNEISLETKIKLENHEMAKYQGNLITFDEVRHQIGKKSSDVDFNGLYTNMVTTKSAIEQIKAKTKAEIDVLKASDKRNNDNKEEDDNATQTAAPTTSTIQGNGKQKDSKNASNGTIKSINTPTNQHGTSSVRIKEASSVESIELSEKISPKRTYIRKKYHNIFEIYQNARDSAVINKSDLEFILSVTFNKIVDTVNSTIESQYKDGISKYLKRYCKDKDVSDINGNDTHLHEILDLAQHTIRNIKNDIINYNYEDVSELQAVFDKYEYRIDYLISYYLAKAKWCGFVYAAKACGREKLYVKFNSQDDAEKYDDTIDLEYYTIYDIPAFHPFCECSLITRRKVDN